MPTETVFGSNHLPIMIKRTDTQYFTMKTGRL
jgi:hypothetical protein